MKKEVLYFLFFVILISSVSALELGTYNTSNPIIVVTYQEKPVTIVYANLSDSKGFAYQLSHTPSSDNMQHNFTAVRDNKPAFLLNDNYVFFVSAMDTDGNEVNTTATFEIAADYMKVWLKYPKLGLAKTRIFNVTAMSAEDSNCKIGFYDQNHPSELPAWFDSLLYFFNKTFEPGKEHNITNFKYPNTQETYDYWIIICNLTETYHPSKSFYFGYDSTAPGISVFADPNPVVDMYNRETLMNVATDDPSVCWYNDTLTGSPKIFEGENKDDAETYKKNHNATISYTFITDPTKKYSFNYNITCQNLAELKNQKTYIVTVKLETNLVITLYKPDNGYSNTSDVNFSVKTNLKTKCQYREVNGRNYIRFDGEGTGGETKYIHSTILNSLQNKEYSYYVKCDAGSSETLVKFSVDTEAPVINSIDAVSPTCSLRTATATINASDNIGISKYSYNFSNSTKTLASGMSQSNKITLTNLRLSNQQTYTWSAIAYDKAGNPSNELISPPVTATDSNGTECDSESPDMEIKVTYSGTEALVRINCTDNVGCADTFMYSMIKRNESCDDATYDTKSYSDLPLTISESGKFCAIVYDLKGNNASDYKLITLAAAPECGNGIREAGEQCDGTDLGGITCRKFDSFLGGRLTCNTDCKWNTENCTSPLNETGYCGDGIINSGEQCDLTLGNITSCSDINIGTGTPTCSFDCFIEGCTPFVNNTQDTCANGIKDAGETDIDCGGSCSGCENTKTCLIDTDCISGNCTDGFCAEVLLPSKKANGESCTYNDDCESNYCNSNVCEEIVGPPTGEGKSHTISIILIIMGVLLMLGGSGYIYYAANFKKKPVKQQYIPTAKEQTKIDLGKQQSIEKQKKIQELREKEREKQRKGLFGKFGGEEKEEEKPKEEKELKKLDEGETEEYVDVEKLKGKGKTAGEKPKQKEVFEKLGKLSTSKGDAFEKLSKLSDVRKLSYDDVAAQLKSYDHKYVRGFLSDLLKQKKIENKTAQEILFHLMDEGKISKAYVAKMMQDLDIL